MIPSFRHRFKNIIKISILLHLILFLFVFVSTALQIKIMKVHPVSMKRNITIRDEIDSSNRTAENLTLMTGNAQKKLRRLPHVFSKVLELPFRSHAHVSIEESSDCLRFIAEIQDNVIAGAGGEVRAHAVEIHPGVIKIVVRGGGENDGEVVELPLDKLQLDVWRFRLPATSRPELASAVVVGEELIVTVPKGDGVEDGRDVLGGVGRLILVQ